MINNLLKKTFNNQLTQDEQDQLIGILKEVVNKVLKGFNPKQLHGIYISADGEDLRLELLEDLFEKLFVKKEIILSKADECNEKEMFYYICKVLKYAIIDKIRKKKIQAIDTEVDIKSYDNMNMENINSKNETQAISEYTNNTILLLEAEEFAVFAKKALTKTEKEALCCDILGIIPANKTTASFEKAKSRARQRLKKLVESKHFPKNIVEVAIKLYFMSTICEEFVNYNSTPKKEVNPNEMA